MDETEKNAKRYLESLGEPALPGDLWQRVDDARRYRLRRRLGAVAASAAFAVLAFVLVLPAGTPDAVDAPVLAEAAMEPAAVQPAAGDEADRIRTVQAIDRALQAAYDRNAGDDEIEPLWRARQAFVPTSAPAAPTG